MAKKLIGAQAEQELIEQIDETCKRLGINRSTLIRRAIEQFLQQQPA